MKLKEFSEHEFVLLHGHYPEIAKACKTTDLYVGEVLRGTRKRNSEKAKSIMAKALKIIEFKTEFL